MRTTLLPAVRRYRSVTLLTAGALALWIRNAPTKEALAGAGAALLGVVFTRWLDIADARHAEAAANRDARRRDLDETRRLAYAALAVSSAPGHPELVATIVNALAHHGAGVDPDEATAHISTIANGAGGAGTDSERWLRAHLKRINDEYERGAGTRD